MYRVVHFEIPAENPERAARFYREIFGWNIQNWGGPIEYWLAFTGSKDQPGIDGAITRAGDMVRTTTNTISVPSVDDFMKKVEAGGGKMLTPKNTILGVGFHAYCQDTEGNVFGSNSLVFPKSYVFRLLAECCGNSYEMTQTPIASFSSRPRHFADHKRSVSAS